MKIITGKHNSAIVYTDIIEQTALYQIQAVVDSELFSDSTIRMMPDLHAGAGCTIGTTMTFPKNRIVPNFVGVDIGCGMLTVNLGKAATDIDLPKFDAQVKRSVPSGFDIRRIPHPFANRVDLDNLKCKEASVRRAVFSIGTLGGGNHFIELAKSENDDNVYLVIHSGSRNLGKQIADYYQKIANQKHPDVPKEFAYVDGEDFDAYLNDMKIAQEYAVWNRRAIADEIISHYFYKENGGNLPRLYGYDQFDTIHNYLDLDGRMLRKGAISAQKDEICLIPMNMRDGSLICKGKGNKEWNYSAPHGAGRILARNAARKTLNLSEFKKAMEGIYTTTANADTLDEAPMAYKPMEEIVGNIKDTVEILHYIKPVYNFKAAENGKRGRR